MSLPYYPKNLPNPKELLVVRVNLEKIRRRFDELTIIA